MAVENSTELLFFSKLEYRGFKVDNYDLATRLSKLKLVDPIWRLNIRKKFMFFSKLEYRGFRGHISEFSY